MQGVLDDPRSASSRWVCSAVLHLGTRSVVGWELDAILDDHVVGAALALLVEADQRYGRSRRFVVAPAAPSTVVDEVAAALADSPVEPSRLWVRVPSTTPIAALHRVREMGVHVAVRDSTGGDALTAMHHGAPIDRLLLLAPGLARVGSPRRGATVLRAMVQLASELGAEVLVEGIIDRSQLVEVQRSGATLGTGSWFGEPSAEPELVDRRTLEPGMVTLHPAPLFEAERVAVIRDASILDTEPEPGFDDLARHAAATFATPMAVVSIVDTDREWAKAHIGAPELAEVPRHQSMCAQTIYGTEPLVVSDTLGNDRFARLRLVTAAPFIRFFAGAPMLTSDGLALGAVGVYDTSPRPHPDDGQLATLERLAELAAQRIELRARMLQLRRLEP